MPFDGTHPRHNSRHSAQRDGRSMRSLSWARKRPPKGLNRCQKKPRVERHPQPKANARRADQRILRYVSPLSRAKLRGELECAVECAPSTALLRTEQVLPRKPRTIVL